MNWNFALMTPKTKYNLKNCKNFLLIYLWKWWIKKKMEMNFIYNLMPGSIDDFVLKIKNLKILMRRPSTIFCRRSFINCLEKNKRYCYESKLWLKLRKKFVVDQSWVWTRYMLHHRCFRLIKIQSQTKTRQTVWLDCNP